MNCLKIKQKLNEAFVKGFGFIILEHISEDNILELRDCGFNVIKQENKFKITM